MPIVTGRDDNRRVINLPCAQIVKRGTDAEQAQYVTAITGIIEDSIEYTSNDPQTLMAVMIDLRAPKSVRQAALRRIREIERATGTVIYGNYNGLTAE